MGFKEEMDLAWQEQVESQAVQEFRATVQNLKYVAEETKAKLDEIVAAMASQIDDILYRAWTG